MQARVLTSNFPSKCTHPQPNKTSHFTTAWLCESACYHSADTSPSAGSAKRDVQLESQLPQGMSGDKLRALEEGPKLGEPAAPQPDAEPPRFVKEVRQGATLRAVYTSQLTDVRGRYNGQAMDIWAKDESLLAQHLYVLVYTFLVIADFCIPVLGCITYHGARCFYDFIMPCISGNISSCFFSRKFSFLPCPWEPEIWNYNGG